MVLPLWVVENRPSPLLWPLAYTTACTTVQAVIYITTFRQMTHNFSSSSIHQISTPTSFTYKMLYNRSLPGWLPIFSLSTLLKLNFFLLDFNKNSLKYTTPQPTPLATLVLFLTNTLPSRTKSLHFLHHLATITFVNFAVSVHTLTSKQPAPLPSPSFILNLTTVTLSLS